MDLENSGFSCEVRGKEKAMDFNLLIFFSGWNYEKFQLYSLL